MPTVRQFVMLRFMGRSFWSEDQAVLFRQRTFGSLCRHRWVDYDVRREAFYVTKAGGRVVRDNSSDDILRRIDTGHLEWGVWADRIMSVHRSRRKGLRLVHSKRRAA